MKKNFALISLIIVLFFLSASVYAQKKKPVVIQGETNSASKSAVNASRQDFLGEFEGNNYKNKFFDLKVLIPENWLVQEREVGNQIKQLGSETVKGKTSQAQKALDEANQRLTVLFTASKDILGIENNAMVAFAAEKAAPLMQIRNGHDYLRFNIQSFKKLQMPPDFKYSETIKSEKFGGETFYYLDIERAMARQRIYATHRKGYSLFFTLTYSSQEDLETIRESLRSSDFSWKE
jgi:uncharacterized protein YxeA